MHKSYNFRILNHLQVILYHVKMFLNLFMLFEHKYKKTPKYFNSADFFWKKNVWFFRQYPSIYGGDQPLVTSLHLVNWKLTNQIFTSFLKYTIYTENLLHTSFCLLVGFVLFVEAVNTLYMLIILFSVLSSTSLTQHWGCAYKMLVILSWHSSFIHQ